MCTELPPLVLQSSHTKFLIQILRIHVYKKSRYRVNGESWPGDPDLINMQIRFVYCTSHAQEVSIIE